jgi:hypothetical protein
MPRIFDNIEFDLLPALRGTLELSDRSDFLRETFDILAGKKISKELLRRRKDAVTEKERGELIAVEDLMI